jgi:hypothetical protein
MAELTKLDEKLRELALTDWQKFVAVIGEDAILKAKICMLRNNGHSYGEIRNKLGVTEKQARYGSGKCDC